MYKKEDVQKAASDYFNGDNLAANVWIDKYALRDKEGKLLELTPDDMYVRLTKEFSRIEQKYPNPLSYEEIYNLLKDNIILPGGSLLYGIGNDYSYSTLGNCFVIGSKSDSYGGICQTDEEQVQLMKRRGGVGHDLSHLRSKGSPTTNSAKTSSGIVPFMERYSNSTREVAQDGRRGALMLTLDVNHPEIENFVTAKNDLTKVTGANISVKVDDNFMNIAAHRDSYSLIFPEHKLWDKLIHQAWKTAEPGVLFWDTIKRESISSCYGPDWQEVSTNPCGEIPLPSYDSCRLLSVNLTKVVTNPFTKDATIDWDKLAEYTYKAQRLMDDVIDLEDEKIKRILIKINEDPEPDEIKRTERILWQKIQTKLLNGRRTGLSAIGLGDMLAMLSLPYGEDSSINLVDEVYKQFAVNAYKSSIDMAKERGAFPIWDYELEKDNPFINRIFDSFEDAHYRGVSLVFGRRNIAILTIPPSGTISLLAGISSGIEPVYQLSYKRRRKVDENHPNKSFQDKNGDWWEEYLVLHSKFKEWYEVVYGNEYDIEVTYFNYDRLIKESPYYGSTAYELNPLDRVKMQGAIQKWVDHSINYCALVA